MAPAALLPGAADAARGRFERIPGYGSLGTPERYDRIGILEVGCPKARNVLVLNPGTSASAAYSSARQGDRHARPRVAVSADERRENFVEDRSIAPRPARQAPTGSSTTTWESVMRHFGLIPDKGTLHAKLSKADSRTLRWPAIEAAGTIASLGRAARTTEAMLSVGGTAEAAGTIASLGRGNLRIEAVPGGAQLNLNIEALLGIDHAAHSSASIRSTRSLATLDSAHSIPRVPVPLLPAIGVRLPAVIRLSVAGVVSESGAMEIATASAAVVGSYDIAAIPVRAAVSRRWASTSPHSGARSVRPERI